jgi:hypothetical protein
MGRTNGHNRPNRQRNLRTALKVLKWVLLSVVSELVWVLMWDRSLAQGLEISLVLACARGFDHSNYRPHTLLE